ncbi:MAG: acyltransferase [Olsenella sp.]|nr:acyltransferase [Olsenella sp.]MCI1288333.1 acyltransferase [Olsenella sp.]
MTEHGKIYCFEWARVLGALAIVALHAMRVTELAPGLAAAHARLFGVEAVLQIPLARWAVPVFLMVSGALLLDPGREMPPRKIGRHVWRMAFVLLTVGLAFCVMEQVADVRAQTGAITLTWGMLGRALLNLLEGNSWDHLWYVYALIGLYLLTPFIRGFQAHATRRQIGLAVVLAWALLCLVPLANLLLNVNLYQFVDLSGAVVYYMLGRYAYEYLELDWRIVAAGVASLALCCLSAGLGLRSAAGAEVAGAVALPQYGLVMPFSLMVFLAFKRFANRPQRERGIAAGLARDSFGIYLFHPLFGHLAIWFTNYGAIPVPALQLGIFVVGVLGSVAITRVLRLLPGFRGKI